MRGLRRDFSIVLAANTAAAAACWHVSGCVCVSVWACASPIHSIFSIQCFPTEAPVGCFVEIPESTFVCANSKIMYSVLCERRAVRTKIHRIHRSVFAKHKTQKTKKRRKNGLTQIEPKEETVVFAYSLISSFRFQQFPFFSIVVSIRCSFRDAHIFSLNSKKQYHYSMSSIITHTHI